MALLLRYKVFSPRDEIGKCPNIKADIQVTTNSPFLLDHLKLVGKTNLLWTNRWKEFFHKAY